MENSSHHIPEGLPAFSTPFLDGKVLQGWEVHAWEQQIRVLSWQVVRGGKLSSLENQNPVFLLLEILNPTSLVG